MRTNLSLDEALEAEDPEGGEARTGSRQPAEGPVETTAHDPMALYLKSVGRVPLLTAPQEVDLAMRIEGGALAAELLASFEGTEKVDRVAFRRVVSSVVRTREHHLDQPATLKVEKGSASRR